MSWSMRIVMVSLVSVFCGGTAQADYPFPSHVEIFDHASTAAESELTGWARYYRGIGEANYWNSLAAQQYGRALVQEVELQQILAAPHIARRAKEKLARAQRAEARRQLKASQRSKPELVSHNATEK